MSSSLFKDLIITTTFMLLSFYLHSFFIFKGHFPEILIKSYVINFMMTSLVFAVIFRFKQKTPELMGFYFLAGSFFKFVVFLLLFLPFFKLDGVLTKQEFLIFFIPYVIVLVVEVFLLINTLNKEE